MKSRYFFLIALILGVFAAIQISSYRSHVAALKSTIAVKDQSSQAVDGDTAVLAAYVARHIGTTTTVFLKSSYDRAVIAAEAPAPSADGQAYAEAQKACGGRSDSVTLAKCVSSYVAAHSAPKANPQPIVMPNKAAYTKTYVAPGWTPEIAGLSLLLAAVFAIFGIYLLIYRRL